LNFAAALTEGLVSSKRRTLPGLVGLINPRGANSCFLNSAVQVLYRLQSFRSVLLPAELPQPAVHFCEGEERCLVCSLARVFANMQEAEQRSLVQHPQAPPPSAPSTAELRHVLFAAAAQSIDRFKDGALEDAWEAHEAMLELMAAAFEPVQGGAQFVDSCFRFHAMHVATCPSCLQSKQPAAHSNFVLAVPAAVLAAEPVRHLSLEEKVASNLAEFTRCPQFSPDEPVAVHGTLLNALRENILVEEGDAEDFLLSEYGFLMAQQIDLGDGATTRELASELWREAAAGKGGKGSDLGPVRKTCTAGGADLPLVRILNKAPRVCTLGIAWESSHAELPVRLGVLQAVQQTLDMGKLFDTCSLPPPHHANQLLGDLRGMVQ
jgi:hypothetical protein